MKRNIKPEQKKLLRIKYQKQEKKKKIRKNVNAIKRVLKKPAKNTEKKLKAKNKSRKLKNPGEANKPLLQLRAHPNDNKPLLP